MVTFQQELAERSYVQNYTNSGSVPTNWYEWSADGVTRLNASESEGEILYGFMRIDENYLPTYGIPLVAGKNFTSEMCARDLKMVEQILINETAAVRLGFASAQDAIGQRITDGREHEIIGVIKDYNHESLKEAILPAIFFPDNVGNYLSIRLTADQMQSKVSELERLYKQQFPGNPFEFFFANERYNQQYQSEQQYGLVFTAASGLAIFIACLGLFGLSAFAMQQRVKEIGIRKVLGASVSSIVSLVAKDFLILVMIANLFAWPLAWWATRHWLQDFAYTISISWWLFALAGALAILIAVFTISFQSIKAAMANPVDSLRNE
jgi:putative ABC transport system permease protein